MIRLILQRDNAAMAANVGGAVLTSYMTFDVDLPEVEAMLRAGGRSETSFEHIQLVGAELLEPSS